MMNPMQQGLKNMLIGQINQKMQNNPQMSQIQSMLQGKSPQEQEQMLMNMLQNNPQAMQAFNSMKGQYGVK